MKLVLARGGGVAGLRAAPIELDASELPAASRDRLTALVDAVRLPLDPDAGAPDQIGYTLTIVDEAGTWTAEFSLATAPPELRALVSEIRRLATAKPGGG